MARKPRDYAAEYAHRKARGHGLGRTTQQARGHAPPPGKTEAQARRERELAEAESIGKLTTPQRGQIRAFARERAAFIGQEEDEAIDEAIAWATANGWQRFREERAFIKGLGMQGMTMTDIELRSLSGEGFPNPKWYYYRTREQMRGADYTPRTEAQRARRRMRDRDRKARRRRRRKAA